jgi:hypothetical protein
VTALPLREKRDDARERERALVNQTRRLLKVAAALGGVLAAAGAGLLTLLPTIPRSGTALTRAAGVGGAAAWAARATTVRVPLGRLQSRIEQSSALARRVAALFAASRLGTLVLAGHRQK